MTVTSSIQVPEDYTRSTFTEVTGSFTFDIIVQEECGESTLDDLILENMVAFDEGAQVEQTFDEVQDSVSRDFGNKDGISFCGARKYELIDADDHAPYLKLLHPRIIQVKSKED